MGNLKHNRYLCEKIHLQKGKSVMFGRLTLLYLISFLLVCCSGRPSDARLEKVAELAADHPTQALDSLAAIDYASLSEANRHYYDFLKIKASDKAYIIHTSDSLILDVINYYSSHKNDFLPEVLYYGGRVYADLGDYPTAIEYFQESLAKLEDTDNLKLKSSVLSQTGQLLHRIRIYSESQKYLKKALSIDSLLNDTLNLANDHQSLGMTYLYDKKFDLAKQEFSESKRVGESVSREFVFDNMMLLAELELRNGNIDTALILINNLPNLVSEPFRNYTLSVGTSIYLKAGQLDSAYKYSYELINSKNQNNQRNGYKYILSKDLLEYLPKDSIPEYFNRYYWLLDDFYNKNESQLAVLETARYNYKHHVVEKTKSDQKSHKLSIYLSIALFFALILLIIILIIKIKQRQTLLNLNATLLKLNNLQQILNSQEKGDSKFLSMNRDVLENWINEKISEITNKGIPSGISPIILQSSIYKRLLEIIDSGKSISDEDEFWDKLRKLITKSNPSFIEKIKILVGRNLKAHELHTLYLIKCGISQTQMSKLMSKTPTTISSRRESLCIKLIGRKIDLKVFDGIIRCL